MELLQLQKIKTGAVINTSQVNLFWSQLAEKKGGARYLLTLYDYLLLIDKSSVFLHFTH